MDLKTSIEWQLRLLNEQLKHCKDDGLMNQLRNRILCLQDLLELERREAELIKQSRLVECDDKPIRFDRVKGTLEEELKRSYCHKCASPELKVTRIIEIECRKCGRKRLITSRLDESKR